MILDLSSEPGPESSLKSGGLLVKIVNIFYPGLGATYDNYRDMASLENCEKVLRKLAHAFEYAVLALLIWLLIYEIINIADVGSAELKYKFLIKSMVLSEIFVICVGSIDEINQTRLAERYGTPVDVLVDAVGGFIMLAIVYLLQRRRKAGTD